MFNGNSWFSFLNWSIWSFVRFGQWICIQKVLKLMAINAILVLFNVNDIIKSLIIAMYHIWLESSLLVRLMMTYKVQQLMTTIPFPSSFWRYYWNHEIEAWAMWPKWNYWCFVFVWLHAVVILCNVHFNRMCESHLNRNSINNKCFIIRLSLKNIKCTQFQR